MNVTRSELASCVLREMQKQLHAVCPDWYCLRTLGPGDALAGSTDKAPVIMITGAKGLPTSHYDDYEIVVD